MEYYFINKLINSKIINVKIGGRLELIIVQDCTK